jgi:hypothetical protein
VAAAVGLNPREYLVVIPTSGFHFLADERAGARRSQRERASLDPKEKFSDWILGHGLKASQPFRTI